MDDSFIKAPLAVPKLSGFDKSHQNLLTSKVGTITPIMVDELIPGSRVSLKLALNASLPPLATDTYMRCSIKTEAFFVPMRLLVASFCDWFADTPKDLISNVDETGTVSRINWKPMLPIIQDTTPGNDSADWIDEMGNGTLSDYLGVRTLGGAYLKQHAITAMPYLAYHKIYNDWYRNGLIQRECFLPTSPGTDFVRGASVAPFMFIDADSYVWSSPADFTLADGHSLLDLRQRNFGMDYFTTAMPSPQQGDPVVLKFDTSGAEGGFSIAALRANNSLQQFRDRNGLLDQRYDQQLYGRYGVRPSDSVLQRSLYLGRGEFEVYSKGVYQTNGANGFGGDPENGPSTTHFNNPFGSVASRYGSAYASGENFLVNFEAKEPGYLFVMATLVPRVTYSSGIDRMMKHYVGEGSLSDMANPILQNVGPQPIFTDELTGYIDPLGNTNDEIFGFTDRYAEFKTKQDTLHGLVRDGYSLDAFALQRTFTTAARPKINSSFLEIPTDYMDQVTAVKEWISEFGYWLDTYFDYKVAMPLSKYSLPTLQDPAYEHGKTVVVNRGGQKI